MPDVSILMTLREDFSAKIEKMRAAGGQFSKSLDDIEEKARKYDQRLSALNETQTEYAVQVRQAADAMKAAQRAFDADGSDANRDALNDAIAKYTTLKGQLDSVTFSAKNLRREYNGLNDELDRIGRSAQSGGGEVSAAASSPAAALEEAAGPGLLKQLAGAGLGNLLGSSLANAAGAYVSSAFGSETGSLISGVAGSAVSGAAMGSLAGPIGTLIGGITGAISGLVNSATEIFQQKDDSFKSYVQNQYDTLTSAVEETLETGSQIAGSREQNLVAFTQRFHSEKAAQGYLNYVQGFAENTNYSYDEIVGYSQKLLNSYSPTEVFRVLTALSDATAGLNLSGSDVDQMIAGLSRMRTTGKTTQEYLNYFSERGVDVYAALSQGLGVEKGDLPDMVTKGQIGGEDAAEIILSYIEETFGGLSADLATTYDAMVDNLEDARANLDAAMGEGYNETRKAGIEAETEFLSGTSGEMMKEAYGMIGQWKATLENQKEQFNREAMAMVMEGGTGSDELWRDDEGNLKESAAQLQKLHEEYTKALEDYENGNEEAGAKMGALLAEAQAIAINEYNDSDGYQIELESQLGLIDKLQEDAALNESYYNAGYQFGVKLSEGLAEAMTEKAGAAVSAKLEEWDAAISAKNAEWSASVASYSSYDEYGNTDLTPADVKDPTMFKGESHAYGLSRVPYDGYPAILHRDEQILTASEARSRAAAPVINVSVSGNEMNVRDEADVDAIASKIADRVSQALELRGGAA